MRWCSSTPTRRCRGATDQRTLAVALLPRDDGAVWKSGHGHDSTTTREDMSRIGFPSARGREGVLVMSEPTNIFRAFEDMASQLQAAVTSAAEQSGVPAPLLEPLR